MPKGIRKIPGPTASERFLKKIRKAVSGCWEWQGSRCHRYGQFTASKKQYKAHRFAFELFVGPIPEGKVVCHACDNTYCVNPDHLFVGMQADNVHDMIKKKRDRKAVGPNAGRSKLTEEKVKEIRANFTGKESYASIGRRYGVASNAIRFILLGLSWRHVL